MKKLVYLLLLLPFAAFAQTVEIYIGGDVTKPYKLTVPIIAQMKQVSAKVKGHDAKEHEYTGVSLYDIITKAGAVADNKLHGKALAKYLLITASDGYQVVIALPEVDPAFTDQVIVLANKSDGKELTADQGPFRLVVPKDKKLARSVMHVTNIDVVTAKK